jgi:hyperosmotically inducible periplasmic protein
VRGRRIDVTTNNGVVTLTGEVGSERERQRAVEIAQATDGVRRVEDQLRVTAPAASESASGAAVGEDRVVEGPPAAATPGAPAALDEQRSDSGITTRVQSKFFTDDEVRARDITVTTENQVVTLAGTVRSDTERQRALSLARSVDGVRSVEDQLTVEGTSGVTPGGHDESGAARSATDGVDDAWITTRIQAKYFVDDLVRGSRVDVSTQRGVVTLSGEVRSEDEKRRAEELARNTEGATNVENRLRVNPSAAGGAPHQGMEPPPAQSVQPDQRQSPQPSQPPQSSEGGQL